MSDNAFVIIIVAIYLAYLLLGRVINYLRDKNLPPEVANPDAHNEIDA